MLARAAHGRRPDNPSRDARRRRRHLAASSSRPSAPARPTRSRATSRAPTPSPTGTAPAIRSSWRRPARRSSGTYYLRANNRGGGAHVANCGYIVAPRRAAAAWRGRCAAHSLEAAKNRVSGPCSSTSSSPRTSGRSGSGSTADLPSWGACRAFSCHPARGAVDALVMHRAALAGPRIPGRYSYSHLQPFGRADVSIRAGKQMGFQRGLLERIRDRAMDKPAGFWKASSSGLWRPTTTGRPTTMLCLFRTSPVRRRRPDERGAPVPCAAQCPARRGLYHRRRGPGRPTTTTPPPSCGATARRSASRSGAVRWKLLSPDGMPLPHDQSPMAMALKENRPFRGLEAPPSVPTAPACPCWPTRPRCTTRPAIWSAPSTCWSTSPSASGSRSSSR